MVINLENAKIGKSIVEKSNKIKNDDNIEFLSDVANNAILVSKEKSPKLVFFKWSKWEQIKDYFSVFGDPSSCCVWDRDELAAATFIFNPAHEFAFFWGSLANKQNKSNLTNVWRCKKERENKSLHPTVKPIEICENAIDAACVDNGLVLDFFGGSGSTMIACENLNNRSRLMELDEKYCDVIINRWQKYTGKKATLELTGQTYEELKQERENA
jgi:DNA modification methylase